MLEGESLEIEASISCTVHTCSPVMYTYYIHLLLLQAFTSALARRHYHSHLKSRIWEAWFGVIRERWRQRVERACQVSIAPQLAVLISYLKCACAPGNCFMRLFLSLSLPPDQSRGSVCQIDFRL